MAAKTAERREELRVALIDAAERAITAGGLASLRARDLAVEVGCALGAIYNVFPNLDSLIFEVNARTLAAFETFLAGAARHAPAERHGNPAIDELVHLAMVYVEFALANRPRWRALFDHRMSAGDEEIPAWYAGEQSRLFLLVEQPLRRLRPDLGSAEAMRFARTLFSGVHGIVSLGLDAKLMALPAEMLKAELREFVETTAAGLLARRETART